ncbi:MAG: iron ABC transporter permease [Candidatus Protistobacter heckmanni]|nr:iron ABC transporter permease [Candidatus Protistobacter heckmanni]
MTQPASPAAAPSARTVEAGAGGGGVDATAHAAHAAHATQAVGAAGSAQASPVRAPAPLRPTLTFAVLAAFSLLALLLACAIGSVKLSPADLWRATGELLAGADPATRSLPAALLELRLHRALAAWSTGALLALAGTMMQALLRNPLADPYVLGVSGGASVGALAAMFLSAAGWIVDASAFAGATAVSLLLLLFAHRDLRAAAAAGNAAGSASLLLLTGVILAAGCSALIALILSIATDNKLRGMVFWMIGDLAGAQARALPWAALLLVFVFCLRNARAVNLLAMYAETAASLGVAVGRLRLGLFLGAALSTACAVTGAGSVGFIGLIVPHACRFALGPDHRLLFPAAAMAGGVFLTLADTAARTVLSPQQLPVGVITALIGVPAFLLQLHQVRRGAR